MIQAQFKRNESGHIVSFEVAGHAGAGPFGSDIVCAAVSALTISTVNGIEALAGFQPIVELGEQEDGYLFVETIKGINQEQINIAQILLENLLLSLQEIEKEHTEFIKIQTIKN